MKNVPIKLRIEGMHCTSCEHILSNRLSKVTGVEKVFVSFATSQAHIQGSAPIELLIHEIHQAGYLAYVLDEEPPIPQKRLHKELFLFAFSALFTLPLLIQMFLEMFHSSWQLPVWIQFSLASIVQIGFGWPFYVGSYFALKNRTSNMDLLICLGTTAAYVFSSIVFLFQLNEHLYFETSAVIITLVLLGRLLEFHTKKRTSFAIQKLVSLQPKEAIVKRENLWKTIPLEEIELGDYFQIKPGAQIPVDGEVIEGHTHIDESMLTGESTPVSKSCGSLLFSGTQNLQGHVIGKAKAVGDKTALAHIIRLIQETQNSRAPIQKYADKISAFFVPIVLGISLLSLIIWWLSTGVFSTALIHAVATVVIACPCALGLATPTAVMVGSGRGALNGILIRNAEAIEKAEKLTLVAFDKTGTLTEGKPQVIDFIPDSPPLRLIVASLEEASEHPIAKALSLCSIEKKLPFEAFQSFSGKGIQGKIKNNDYTIGSTSWMEEKGLHVDKKIVEHLQNEAKTVVCLSDNTQILSYIGIRDAVRPKSYEAAATLKNMGLKIVMLTGDSQKTARAIAQELEIETVYSELLPPEKAHLIMQLKKEGHKVGMVGDGINDAPALAAADVGFAMRSGADIAMESADITLMHNDVRQVVNAIDLSKTTFRKIRQNLFFAFIYNLLGIPLAALGLLSPMIAAAAMALSSLCVVGNSLLLNLWNPKF